jgi:hypothetical protein
MKFQYQDGHSLVSASIDRIGPIIVVSCFDEEFWTSLQVCYNQADQATAAISLWEIDGVVKIIQLVGTNSDWGTFWKCFLDGMPPALASAVASLEDQYKY